MTRTRSRDIKRETAAEVRRRYAPFVARVRKKAVRVLTQEDIPGGLRLFQRRTAIHGTDGKWSRNFLGKYSSNSFLRTGAPNISINPGLIHANCQEHNRKADPVLDDPLDPETVAVDTVLHEYGHAIQELIREEAPRLHRIVARQFDDEEEFAEEFMIYLRGGGNGFDEFFLRFVDLYRRFYRKTAGPPQEPPASTSRNDSGRTGP